MSLDAVARPTGTFALLCYERNPADCHRSVVAAALARRANCKVRHLMVPAAAPSDESERTRTECRQIRQHRSEGVRVGPEPRRQRGGELIDGNRRNPAAEI